MSNVEETDERDDKDLADAPGDDDEGVGAQEEFVEDGRADRALDFVVDVLTRMGMDCTVDLMENEPEDPASDIRIEISGPDASRPSCQ